MIGLSLDLPQELSYLTVSGDTGNKGAASPTAHQIFHGITRTGKRLPDLRALHVSCGKHERTNPGPKERVTLEWPAADAFVLCQHKPVALAGNSKPLFVTGIGSKVIVVNLHPHPRLLKHLGHDTPTERTVQEVN